MTVRPNKKTIRVPSVGIRTPSRGIEYAYYLSIAYSMFGPALGLAIPFVAGQLTLFIAAICVWQLRASLKMVYSPIILLLASGISLVLIQVIVYDASLVSDNIRSLIAGYLQLVTIYSLSLRRGFSLRFPLVLFILGAMVLPFLTLNPGEVEKARVDSSVIQGTLTHPGGLGEWFGFCAVYFAILGLESERFKYRVGAWLAAVASLLVATLSVERGPIFGTVLAITFGFRRVIKRGFLPVVLLIILTGVLSVSGLFDQAVSHYSQRGMEETGRETLWPEAIERISTSPLLGVGLANTGNPGPHNSFLFFALSSGVVPLAFYTAFWIQVAWRSAVHAKGREDQSFRIPYLIFVFITAMLTDTGFMSYFGFFAFSLGARSAIMYRYRKQRPGVIRAGDKGKRGPLPGLRSPETISVGRHRL